jgi:hypothetical protein
MARWDALTAGAFGKHLATHKVANGHDFWQSGSDCFCCGQQGMSSAIPAMSSIAVMGSAVIIAAADGAAIGAVRRLRTARIESRRGSKDQNFTHATSHIARRKKRWRGSHQCQPGLIVASKANDHTNQLRSECCRDLDREVRPL